MLEVKTFTEIVNRMANWILSHNARLTNFRVGSVIRTVLESVAIEIEGIYFEMRKGFKSAVENSVLNSFGFSKVGALYATGHVMVEFRVPIPQEVIIPLGYMFSTSPSSGKINQYETTETVICKPGVEQVLIPVRSTEPGILGNVSANTVVTATIAIPFLDKVYNPDSILGGRPEETSEERKKRFTEYVNTLSKGTVDALEYGCYNVEGITGVFIDEGVGVVYIYAHNAQGDLPEPLKADIEKMVMDYKAGGIEVFVLPIIKKPIDLFISVQLAGTATASQIEAYRESIRSSVIDYMDSFSVSQNLLRADIITYVMSFNPNLIINTIIDMPEDIITAGMELIRAGNITISVYK